MSLSVHAVVFGAVVAGCGGDDADPAPAAPSSGATGDADDGPATGSADAEATAEGDGSDTGADADGTTDSAVDSGDDTSGDEFGDTGEPNVPPPPCEVDLSTQLEALGVPGLSVGIVRDGAVACVSVIGTADFEEDRPVAVDTAFAWASVSKTMTAAAAMALVEDGMVGLDDDVSDLLPFTVQNPNCPGGAVTLRNLLTHTSSIVDDDDTYYSLYTEGDSPIALGDFEEGYLVPGGEYYDADGNFANRCPGEDYSYSNIATGLIGHVVAEVAGMPFDAYCRQRIYEPLGMQGTSFHLAELDPTQVAMPYEGSGAGSFEANGHNGFPTYPDGLLRASVADLGRFLAMVAAGGSFNGRPVLAAATVEEMLRVQDADLDDTQALIWYYDTTLGDEIMGHSGSDPGTSSLMFFDKAKGTGALLVTNGDFYASGEDAAYELLLDLLDEADA